MKWLKEEDEVSFLLTETKCTKEAISTTPNKIFNKSKERKPLTDIQQGKYNNIKVAMVHRLMEGNGHCANINIEN